MVNGNPGTYVSASRGRTATSALSLFLEREINIGIGTRSSASTSQNRLRSILVAMLEADATFPRVLIIADNDFLGGSWARQTKI